MFLCYNIPSKYFLKNNYGLVHFQIHEFSSTLKAPPQCKNAQKSQRNVKNLNFKGFISCASEANFLLTTQNSFSLPNVLLQCSK